LAYERQAFRYLINLYISFRRADWFGEADAEDSLLLTMDDEAQHRCAGFLQAEIERYAEEMEDASDVASNKEDKEDSSSDSDDDEQDKPAQKDRKSAKMQKIRQEKLGMYCYPSRGSVLNQRSFAFLKG
jgi:cohesin complex subunit SA-1/2